MDNHHGELFQPEGTCILRKTKMNLCKFCVAFPIRKRFYTMCGKNDKCLPIVTPRFCKSVTDFIFIPFKFNLS